MKRFVVAVLFFTAVLSSSFSKDVIHVIVKGDTLFGLSRKYGVSVDELCAYNNLSDASKIKLGQSIKIPSKEDTSKKEETYGEYLVKSGDTLFAIARAYDTSVDVLRTLNNMDSNTTLKSGQKIRVPGSATATAPVIAGTNATGSGSSASGIGGTESKTVVSVKDYAETTVNPIEDPRQLKTRAIDSKTVWPVKASQMSYVSGKTNSVLLNGGKGEKVTAIRSGNVIFSGVFRGSGLVVFVQPKSTDYVYVYSGFDNVVVKKGDTVEYGAVLGTLGVNAVSQKPELNFMVYKNGSAIDPATAPRG